MTPRNLTPLTPSRAGRGPDNGLDVVEPVGVARFATVQGCLEDLLHFGRDWAGLAGADFAIIELDHRRNFGGGAGHKGFVGDVECVAGEIFLAHLDTIVAQNPDDRVARDSRQY